MPGLSIHYAVATHSTKQNNITNLQDYINGSFYPDLDQKLSRHYSDPNVNPETITGLQKKVNLQAYIKEHSLNSDFEKGYFMHLVTDYLFYHDLCIKMYHKDSSMLSLLGHWLAEYNGINTIVYNNYPYNIEDIPQNISQYFVIDGKMPKYFTEKNITDFVNYCSSLDLNQVFTNLQKGVIPVYPLDV